MHKPVAGVLDVPSSGVLPALAVCAVCFFLGSLAGCVLTSHIAGGASESLDAYLCGFLKAAEQEALSTPSLLFTIWETVRWPLLALLLGFTVLGLIGIPILFIGRGFLLAFSIASFVHIFGSAGCLLAFLVFGLTGVISVPVLFLVGVQSLLTVRRLAGRSLGENRLQTLYGRAYFQRCGVCIAALVVCVVLEYLMVPTLVSGLAGAMGII